MRQTMATCSKLLKMWQHACIKHNMWQHVGSWWPFCEKPVCTGHRLEAADAGAPQMGGLRSGSDALWDFGHGRFT